MSIVYEVLGEPGRDNALSVHIETGQRVVRLLFDCGEGVLAPFPLAELRALDGVFFSHLHMDHVSGFDMLFRATYDREDRPNAVYGPPETARILHHRFQGYMWNLAAGQPGIWEVSDVYRDHIASWRYTTADAYAVAHPLGTRPFSGLLVDDPAYTVAALEMDHLTPSLAYVVREKPRLNINPDALARLALPPGAWLQRIKTPTADEEPEIEIGGIRYELAALRRDLLIETPGDSIAYLTDFRLDAAARDRLAPFLAGCDTVICECQYRDADAELAARHHHMTASAAALLAREAGIKHLVLFHVSARYRPPDWLAMLAEARAIFPKTDFPARWEVA